MCTLSVSLNDRLVAKARTAFADEDAFLQWLGQQVSQDLETLIAEHEDQQHALVKSSLEQAFAEMRAKQEKADARSLFA